MRRHSDTSSQSAVAGRRARDRLLEGDTPPIERAEVDNLLLFVGDDLKASAAAVGGIEQFLVAVHNQLAGELTAQQVEELLADADVRHKLGELDAAMDSLLRSMDRLRGVLSVTAR